MNQKIKNKIIKGIESTLKQLKKEQSWELKTLPELDLELPRDTKHGDLSSNIAMVLAKIVKSPPREVAQSFIDAFKSKNVFAPDFVDKAEIAGPGFINFYLSESLLYEELDEILQKGAQYGQADEPRNQKIHLEFVSANPTGPLNVVSARAAAVGDTLARLLTADGYEVQKEFYINDAGNQVRLLGKSVEARFRELFLNLFCFHQSKTPYSQPNHLLLE